MADADSEDIRNRFGKEQERLAKLWDAYELQEKDFSTARNKVRAMERPPMVLNITNSRTIACLYGENYDCWKGNSIQIYATQVRAFGQKQMALRIREAKPNINQNLEQHEIALKSCENLGELQKVFMAIPKHLKPALSAIKDGMKNELSA